jgi:hypothetical protein
MQKLGVKPGHRVSVAGIRDLDFDAELVQAGADFLPRVRKDSDLIFLGIKQPKDLARVGGAAKSIVPNGAVWVVYPKGVKHITQAQVMSAILESRLVDVKVCSFSATHTALKAVIPVAQRTDR